MKNLIKTTVMLSLIIATIIFSCKKKESTTEDPVPPTPTPTPATPVYSTFASTIIIVDYTAPINLATSSYTANLSPTTTAIAYIVADSVRIDSLSLVITRTTDIVPSTVTSSTASPCDWNIWNTYSLNSKEFKLKTGSNNSLEIYEDGVLVSSRPILIKETYNIYDFSNGYNTTNPKTLGLPCADGKRYMVVQ